MHTTQRLTIKWCFDSYLLQIQAKPCKKHCVSSKRAWDTVLLPPTLKMPKWKKLFRACKDLAANKERAFFPRGNKAENKCYLCVLLCDTAKLWAKLCPMRKNCLFRMPRNSVISKGGDSGTCMTIEQEERERKMDSAFQKCTVIVRCVLFSLSVFSACLFTYPFLNESFLKYDKAQKTQRQKEQQL